ncbi:MAG: metallophosphoesterase [bacterium]|nr:metallophosphoesterase [bacterium]
MSSARADWSFAILGDTRGNDNGQDAGVSPNLNAIAEKIAGLTAPKPAFVLVNGDLISGELIGSSYADFVAQFTMWKTSMNPVQASNIPIYPVRGNHENEIVDVFPPVAELKQAYYDLFAAALPTNGPNNGPDDDQRGFSYSFAHSNVTVVAVDQYFNYNQYTNISPQNMGYHSLDQSWVVQQLQTAGTPFKMVMVHEPAFISTGQDLGEQFFGTEADGLQRRADFWNALGSNGCQLYVCGHVHGLSVASVADAAGHKIIQLMTGNGGAAPLDTLHTNHEAGVDVLYTNGSNFGFALATVGAGAMTINYYLLNTNDTSWSVAPYATVIQTVPEPSRAALLAVVAGFFVWSRSRSARRPREIHQVSA